MLNFGEISGHTRELGILKKAISTGRVAHAYLFSGPEGIGKRTLALAFARALNCQEGSGDACGVCPDCRTMEAGVHPNLSEVWPTDTKGNRTVEGIIRIGRIRELQDSLRYRAERGKKVAVVESAERLNAAAANAFLKTLEEPPADSVIILVTSRATELLPTILSRCQRMNFRPLSDGLVTGFLEKERGLSTADARAMARISSGSISRAVKFSEAGIFEKRRETVERVLALDRRDTFEILRLAEELSRSEDLLEVLDFLKTWVRDMALYGEGADGLMVNGDLAGLLKRGGGAANPRDLTDSFSMIEKARHEIMPPNYANKQLAVEVLLMGLAGRLERSSPR